jgi:hypothetical protein
VAGCRSLRCSRATGPAGHPPSTSRSQPNLVMLPPHIAPNLTQQQNPVEVSKLGRQPAQPAVDVGSDRKSARSAQTRRPLSSLAREQQQQHHQQRQTSGNILAKPQRRSFCAVRYQTTGSGISYTNRSPIAISPSRTHAPRIPLAPTPRPSLIDARYRCEACCRPRQAHLCGATQHRRWTTARPRQRSTPNSPSSVPIAASPRDRILSRLRRRNARRAPEITSGRLRTLGGWVEQRLTSLTQFEGEPFLQHRAQDDREKPSATASKSLGEAAASRIDEGIEINFVEVQAA